MALIFRRYGIDLTLGAGTDVRVKVSVSDTTSSYLFDKLKAGSTKITATINSPGGNETLDIDVDETQVNHDNLLNYDINQHRELDDAQTTTDNLWSADKIQTELDGKINAITAPVSDNLLTKTIGLDGNDLETTGISVDDSDNVQGINNLIVSGDLTVNGTTTSVNSDVLEVVDPNITVNKGGTQASADLADAGLTVEMSDATDVVFGYDSTLTSKWKVGESGDLREVLTSTHAQGITNKTINADNNTITNLRHGEEVDDPSSDVHGVGLGNDIVGTGTTQVLENKTIDGTSVTGNNTISVDAVNASYNNATSGMVATEAQGALDELDGRLDALEGSYVESFNTRTGAVLPEASDYDADQVDFDPSTSSLTATDVQGAIDEETGRLDNHLSQTSGTHGVTGNIVGTTDVQTLTNKTIDVDNNTVSNVELDNFKASAITTDLSSSALATEFATAESIKTYVDNFAPSGDLIETVSPILDNQNSFVDVSGFLFSNATVRSFNALVSVSIDATTDYYEEFEIRGIQTNTDWDITISSIGESLVELQITTAGQIQYTSPSYTGFTAGQINFRAITTTK